MRPLRLGLAALGALAVLGAAAPAAAAACGPVETVPDEGHHHLVEGHDPPVPYGSTPPTSGWHHRLADESGLGVHDDPLAEPEQVSVLAGGGVVVSYHDLPDEDVAALEGYVAEEARAVALTPYDRLDAGRVAVAAWNRKQVCAGLDLDAVSAFVEAHAVDDLDLTMGGHAHDEATQGRDDADDEVADAAAARPDDGGGIDVALAVLAAGLAALAAGGLVLGLRKSAGSAPGS